MAEKHNSVYDGMVSKLFEFFCDNLPEKGRVPDVGSGTGLPFAKILVERGLRVVGIDVSPCIVGIARMNVPQAEYRELSMTDINFKDEFDRVLSSFSILLLDPPLFRDAASRIVRSLKEGGLFYLSLNKLWEEGADIDGEAMVEIMGEKMYSRAYTEEEVLEAFVPLGMKQLRFQREV